MIDLIMLLFGRTRQAGESRRDFDFLIDEIPEQE